MVLLLIFGIPIGGLTLGMFCYYWGWSDACRKFMCERKTDRAS